MKYILVSVLMVFGISAFGQIETDSSFVPQWTDGVLIVRDHPDSVLNLDPDAISPNRYLDESTGRFYYYDKVDSVFLTPNVIEDTRLPNGEVDPLGLHSIYFRVTDSSYWRNFNMTDSSWIQISN